MINFATTTQDKITELLTSTSTQQERLLNLVDELKSIQNNSLAKITASEQELIKKKDFEKTQNEAVGHIKNLLSDLQTKEDEKKKTAEQEKNE